MVDKTPTEFLNGMGLASIRTEFGEVLAGMRLEPFTTFLIGIQLESFPGKCHELKKKAASVNAKVVVLDNKVIKLKDVTEDCSVRGEMKQWRSKACGI